MVSSTIKQGAVLHDLFIHLSILQLLTTSCQYYAAAAAKLLQSCPTLCDPIDGSPPVSLVPGISRQEYWRGVPLPSPSIMLVVKNTKKINMTPSTDGLEWGTDTNNDSELI